MRSFYLCLLDLNQTLSPHICDWNNSFSQYRWKIEIKGTTKENMFFFQDRIKDQSVSNKRMRQKPPIHFYRNYLLYLHTRAYKSPRYSRILVFYVVCTISCNDSALWAITRDLCMGGNTHYRGHDNGNPLFLGGLNRRRSS